MQKFFIKPVQKQCFFCTTSRDAIDYKNPELLHQFMSSQAKIYPRKKSGLCAYHQRRVANAVKKARYLALLPYISR